MGISLRNKKKTEKKATTARIAIWYIISSVFAKGLAVITTPIFTRLLSKTEFGQFSSFTSVENILTIIVTLDFSASIARAKYDFDERMKEYIASILLASNIVTTLVYIVVECNAKFFQELFSMDILYIRMLFVYLLFMPAFSYMQLYHRVYQKYKFFVAFSMGTALISAVISVILVVLLDDKLLGRTVGYLLPISIFNFFLWIYVFIKAKRVSWDCIIYASKISIPLIPNALSGVVLGSMDRIMITNICGAATTAIYTVAYQVSMLVYLIWTSMNHAWSPWLFDRLHEDNHEAIRRSSKLYLGIFLGFVIGVLLVAPEVVVILGGQAYYEAIYVMPPVVLGCVFQFVFGMYVNLEIYEKKTFTISMGTMMAALINFVLNFVCIPRFGYIAAAYTTLIGFMALFIFHYIIVQIKIRKYANVYDKKFVGGVLLIATLCSAVSLILYQCNVIRYLLLVAYIVMGLIGGYKYREFIKKLLGIKQKKC